MRHRHARIEYTALGALVGLALGAGLAVGLDRLDPRLRSREEAELVFGYPVLVEVPRIRRRRQGQFETVAATQPGSDVANAFRSLRAALLLTEVVRDDVLVKDTSSATNGTASRSQGVEEILVVSPAQGDGKSCIVANLAASLAETQRSIVVVSGDLRRPRIHQYFGAGEAPGLTDILASPGPSLDQVVQPTNVPGVELLAAGTPVANEVALLARVGTVMTALRERVDAVVIDTPGLLVASDAWRVPLRRRRRRRGRTGSRHSSRPGPQGSRSAPTTRSTGRRGRPHRWALVATDPDQRPCAGRASWTCRCSTAGIRAADTDKGASIGRSAS